ncbi:tartrate dehydrogenase [Parapusillimonas sp. JC17]|uniref:tartrate dehydrogenase n=1 Tax=Parapusillimonas sp. JC17 TaxID=3445768 RepID=UPI003FA0D14E
MKRHKIAVIAGDGIGQEVMPEGLRVLKLAGENFQIGLDLEEHDWGCHQYEATGSWMPSNWKEHLGACEAIFFGACGWPETVPDHVSLWDSLLRFRREFDQYVNLRPVRLMAGVACPLAGMAPGDIDYWVIRENTEGEYSSVGGRMYQGTEREIAVQQATFSRYGVDRILRYAFDFASKRSRQRLTSATKSNGINITMPFWDERFAEVAKEFPSVTTSQFHIDALTIKMVLDPRRFDVIVASNLFGDILSDLGPATAGTIGIAPSANINPERCFPSLFEPVHGSAPDIFGKRIANPIAQIWSGALMLEHLGYAEAGGAILEAIEHVLLNGPRTPDLGGDAHTEDVGEAICEYLRRRPSALASR